MYANSQRIQRQIRNASLSELIATHYTAKEIYPIYTDILLPSQNRTPDPSQCITKQLFIKEFKAVVKDPALGKAFFNAMSPTLRKAISILTWIGKDNLYTFEQELGATISKVDPDATFHDDKILPEKGIHWFLFTGTSHYHYYENDSVKKLATSISLPTALRRWFKTFLPKPEDYNLKPVETLPENASAKILTYRCDDTIIEDLRITADYIIRGNLKFTKSEKITKPCIRSIENITDSGDFFPDNSPFGKKISLLRHEILAGILSVIGSKRLEEMRKDTPNPRIILRELLASIFGHSEWVHEFILTHIKETYKSCHQPDAATQLTHIFKKCGTDGWITLENILHHIKYQNIDTEIFSNCTIRLKKKQERYSYIENIDVTSRTEHQFYTTPLLQGFPFLLAALGLAEIAYTLPPESYYYQRGSNPYISPYDGFLALRLTPFGNYAIRNTDEVEIKPSKKKRAEINLNPQRLTVACRNVDPVTELALLEFMEKHSPGCYRLTRETFMKGCTTAQSVKERIEQFKRNITSDLPPLWEEFLTGIESSAIALKSKTGYKIYQLAHTPELKEIFSTDSILTENTTKVAGLQIAIHKKNLPTVTDRLKTLGYLIG